MYLLFMKYSRVSLFVLFVLLTSTCRPALASSSSPPLVITEVGAYEKSGADALEWIEVYNRSNEPIDITTWKFLESSGVNLLTHGISSTRDGVKNVAPGSYAVIAQNDVNLNAAYPDLSVPVFDSSWSTLSLDGEVVGLKDEQGTAHTFAYLASSQTSVEKIDSTLDDTIITNWRVAPYTNSLGKATSISTLTSTSEIVSDEKTPEEFIVTTTSTPEIIAVEIPVVTLPETTTVTSSNTPEIAITVTSSVTDLLTTTSTPELPAEVTTALVQPSPLQLSELMPNPDSEPEWIEIYNHSSNAYDTSACYLKDRTGKEQLHDVLAPESYTVIDVKNITLNNSGDEISIVCNDSVVDVIQYGSIEGIEKSITAPVPKKGQALIRKSEYAPTSVELFGVGQPTKGFINNLALLSQTTSPIVPTTVSSEPTVPIAIDVVINEVVAQSSGDDLTTEFIELYNRGNFTTDLRGWKITDGSVQYTIKDSNEIRFPPGAYYVVNRTSSTIALGLSGTLTLTDPNSQKVDQTKFNDMEAETSWSRFGNDWNLTSLITKGVENSMKRPNHAPIARLTSVKNATTGTVVLFSSEDSTDQDGDVLQYLWEFGDGSQSNDANPSHAFTQSGSYPVTLTVRDGQRSATVQKNIIVSKPVTISSVAQKPVTTKRTKSTMISYQYNPVDLETLAELPNNTPVIVEGVIHYINKNSRIRSFYLGNPGIEVQLGSVLAEYLKLDDSVRVHALVSISTSGARVLKVKDLSVIPSLSPIVPNTHSLQDVGLHETDYIETTGTIATMKGREISLTDETGTCKVTLPISRDTLKIGDTVRVTGSSIKSSSACKIIISKPELLEVLNSTSNNTTLGTYIPVTATGLSSVALAALWKKKSSLITLITNIWKRNMIA